MSESFADTQAAAHQSNRDWIAALMADIAALRTLLDSTRDIFSGMLSGSATWDPGSIADGDEEATDITVTGAALGDFVLVSFSLDVADLVLTAQVTATDVVTAQLANNTGGAVDLASGTVYVRVLKRTATTAAPTTDVTATATV